MIRFLRTFMGQRPLLTKMMTGGTIASAADMLSQLAIEKRSVADYDYWRTGRFFLTYALFVGPSQHFGFQALEKVKGGHAMLLPLKRLLIEQICIVPLFQACFLIVLRLLERYSLAESYEMMTRDWWTIYCNGIKVWPMVSLVNFYVVPYHLRVYVIQVFSFFWSMYLSYRTQNKLEPTWI